MYICTPEMYTSDLTVAVGEDIHLTQKVAQNQWSPLPVAATGRRPCFCT